MEDDKKFEELQRVAALEELDALKKFDDENKRACAYVNCLYSHGSDTVFDKELHCLALKYYEDEVNKVMKCNGGYVYSGDKCNDCPLDEIDWGNFNSDHYHYFPEQH
jgi:hypothetical protein